MKVTLNKSRQSGCTNGEITPKSHTMNVFQKFAKINTLIFDVDGVFTNSDILITEEGELLRSMSTQDGYAVKKAMKKGYNVAIITKGNSKGVVSRLEGLHVLDIYSGVDDKLEIFKEYCNKKNINPDSCLYMGDDISDIVVLSVVLLSTCPNDAVRDVLDVCEYISPYNGGDGCVRDVIERVLRVNNDW